MLRFDANKKHYRETPSGVFEYVGPQNLEDIESRLLEIEAEKPARLHNLQEDYSASWNDEVEAMAIASLDVEKTQLQLRRQFILDKRDNWRSRMIWNMIVPIAVAIITACIVTGLNLKI